MNSSSTISAEQLGERLKLRRLSKGLSLEELAAAMEKSISKQALSKFEKGRAMPSAQTLAHIAAVLGVPAARLLSPERARISSVAYRKGAGLLVREREALEAKVRVELENRARLASLLDHELDLPDERFAIETIEEAEGAAQWLRQQWNLGLDAMCSLSAVLEDHGVHIVEIEAAEKFNGLSARIEVTGGKQMAAVIARAGLPGDRWRFTVAHELAHLVLEPAQTMSDKDKENAAHRFAGAFLAPRALVEREVGKHRTNISLPELFLLKRSLGLSAQAVSRRLKDLQIISEDDYKSICVFFSKQGWRKDEPHKLKPETPIWFKQSVYRALAEGLIGRDEAQDLLGGDFDSMGLQDEVLTARRSRDFARLPLAEQSRLLRAQADLAAQTFISS